MKSAVISRAWRGETPYICSWVSYYLDTLGFDRAIILRCDAERFEFLSDTFGDRIRFLDRHAYNGEDLFSSLVNFEIPRDIDYLFSCDVDEFLVLHGKSVGDFVGQSNWDSCFLWWGLCCSTRPCSGDLKDNLKLGLSLGHDGKTLFKSSKVMSFHNEHQVNMLPGSEFWVESEGLHSSPYVLHMCCRGFEDLMLRSTGQVIKVDAFGDRYLSCLNKPPRDFNKLPLRFKVAYLQSRMPKVPFRCEIPSLLVDTDRLESLFKETGAPINLDLFDRDYGVADLLVGYPQALYGIQRDFNEVVREAESLFRLRSII